MIGIPFVVRLISFLLSEDSGFDGKNGVDTSQALHRGRPTVASLTNAKIAPRDAIEPITRDALNT
jgi:hypothetical protein